MNDWLRQNAWPLIISVIGFAMMWGLYGYRLDQAEKAIQSNTAQIEVLRGESTTNQVLLAQIQKDIEYIKIQVNKIAN